jgi:hypothetical protein
MGPPSADQLPAGSSRAAGCGWVGVLDEIGRDEMASPARARLTRVAAPAAHSGEGRGLRTTRVDPCITGLRP